MQIDLSRYFVKIASTEEERAAARRLRYRVFVEEMGAKPRAEEASLKEEWDRFDDYFENLILVDRPASDRSGSVDVVGVYRLMTDDVARNGIGFYGSGEYDLSLIENSGRKSVELGRSCVDRKHRGGAGMHLMWNGLAEYVLERNIEILFGVASFHGTDPEPIAQALTYLHHNHLASPDLRVKAAQAHYLGMELLPADAVDRATAMKQIPALIKAYLRLGGAVGEGAFVDLGFNTIDVCVIMDTTTMKDRYLQFYQRNLGSRL